MTHTAAFDLTGPVVGTYVTGTSEGPGYSTAWAGTYQGVRPSEHDGTPVHVFTDGILGRTPQTTFAIPADQFGEVRPLLEVLTEHVTAILTH